MNLPVTALGIDIAKLKFDVCLVTPSGRAKHKVFQNTRHGFEQLVAWLNSHQVVDLHACLEATGTYGEPLALFLFEAAFMVSLVNPAAVRAFANAGLSRTKNDKVDAELIARFCLAQQPQAWQPPDDKRFSSATRISISASSRRTKACSSRNSGAGGCHACGCCARQKRAISSASTLSVLVRDKPALAKARTAAGLAMLTVNPASNRNKASGSP